MLRIKPHIGADTHSLMNGVSHGHRSLCVARRKPDPVDLYGYRPRLSVRMNPALLLGAITGAMTSTPAMNVVTEAARSDVPALGYAGTYTFANVLLRFAGALMMRV
jgi:hypothetical protein